MSQRAEEREYTFARKCRTNYVGVRNHSETDRRCCGVPVKQQQTPQIGHHVANFICASIAKGYIVQHSGTSGPSCVAAPPSRRQYHRGHTLPAAPPYLLKLNILLVIEPCRHKLCSQCIEELFRRPPANCPLSTYVDQRSNDLFRYQHLLLYCRYPTNYLNTGTRNGTRHSHHRSFSYSSRKDNHFDTTV